MTFNRINANGLFYAIFSNFKLLLFQKRFPLQPFLLLLCILHGVFALRTLEPLEGYGMNSRTFLKGSWL